MFILMILCDFCLSPAQFGYVIVCELLLLQLSSLQPHSKDRAENTISNITSVFACVSGAAGTCLPSCCLEAALVCLLNSWSLHINGSTPQVLWLWGDRLSQGPEPQRGTICIQEIKFLGVNIFLNLLRHADIDKIN
jgi:hypothetical protein